MEEEERIGVSEEKGLHELTSRKFSPRIIAIIIVILILTTSAGVVWYEYYRHWDIQELEHAIDFVAGEDNLAPVAVGFRTSLAGRTITVEGIVSSVRSHQTNQGQIDEIFLEGGELISLRYEGESGLGAGDHVEMRVTFEWANINGARGVYSPQTCLGIGILEWVQRTIWSTSLVCAECITEYEESDEDLKIRIVKLKEPVPLAMINCSLREGANDFALDYIDALGRYSMNREVDRISNLSDPVGQNGTILFMDMNEDGYLDDGDFFTLRNLTRPDTACSAQTYMLNVDRTLYPNETDFGENHWIFFDYVIMAQGGMIWNTPPIDPIMTSILSPVEMGVEMTIDYVSQSVGWDDIIILVSDGTYNVDWEINGPIMNDQVRSNVSCGIRTLDGVDIECVLSDEQGNGVVDIGDRISLFAENGTLCDEGVILTITLIYSHTSSGINYRCFKYGDLPSREYFSTTDNQTTVLTFYPHYPQSTYMFTDYVDVHWDEINIKIWNGSEEVEIAIDIEELDGGTISSWDSGEQSFGDLEMEFIVTDLQGNGILNSGDSISITVISDDSSNPDDVYQLSIYYIPLDSELCVEEFSG